MYCTCAATASSSLTPQSSPHLAGINRRSASSRSCTPKNVFNTPVLVPPDQYGGPVQGSPYGLVPSNQYGALPSSAQYAANLRPYTSPTSSASAPAMTQHRDVILHDERRSGGGATYYSTSSERSGSRGRNVNNLFQQQLQQRLEQRHSTGAGGGGGTGGDGGEWRGGGGGGSAAHSSHPDGSALYARGAYTERDIVYPLPPKNRTSSVQFSRSVEVSDPNSIYDRPRSGTAVTAQKPGLRNSGGTVG